MILISFLDDARITDKARLERIKKLGVSDEEALEILAYDKQVEAGKKTEYDLKGERAKAAKEARKMGFKTKTEKGKKTIKENPTKSAIIEALFHYLENDMPIDGIGEVEILNKEREILFKAKDDWYTLVLTYKRNMNKNK